MSNYETLNACAVTAHVTDDDVRVLMPRTVYSREEALMFAAWLVAMATLGDDEPARCGDIIARVEAVRST